MAAVLARQSSPTTKMTDPVNPRATKKPKGPSGPLTKEETQKLKSFEKNLRAYSRKIKNQNPTDAKDFRRMANTLTRGRLVGAAKSALNALDVDLKSAVRRHPWVLTAVAALSSSPLNVGEDEAVRVMNENWEKKKRYDTQQRKRYAYGGRVAKYKK